jgi:sugar-specific transcriptional regulator TrmB
MNARFTSLLEMAGLTRRQALVYEILLDQRMLSVSKIALAAKMKRTNVYNILEQLERLELVYKIVSKKAALRAMPVQYAAAHPKELVAHVHARRDKALQAEKYFDQSIGHIIAAYNYTHAKPSIRFVEGVEGIEAVHQNLIEHAAECGEVKLIRSSMDREYREVYEKLQTHIAERVAHNMPLKVVGPLPHGVHTDIRVLKKTDKARLVTRRVIDGFHTPTQVLIFANTVAITDFTNTITTTLIESESVRHTFEKMFEVMYKAGRKV